MISDEQLIERLRRSMTALAEDVLPPAGLLDGISASRPRRFRLPGVGGLAVGVAIACTLAVALVAITSLRQAGTGTAARPTSAPPARPAAPANSLAALRSELAILRGPQRAADRLTASGIAAEEQQRCSNCLNLAHVVHGETRLIATVHVPRSDAAADGHGPERIYLVLGTVPKSWENGRVSGWRQRGSAIRGLHLSLFGLTSRRSATEQPIDELLNPAEVPMPADALTPQTVMITSFATIGVVPDGVARVKWELVNPGQVTPKTVYPRVHGNVAIAPWTPAPRSSGLIDEQMLAGATWYAADGRVIAAFSDLAQIGRVYGH